jgi:hypothetical protein
VIAFNFRTDGAIAQGWLERGRRVLEGLDQAVPEHGMLAILGAHSALMGDHDLVEARRLCEAAEAVGRELDDPDIEMSGRALRGLVLVTRGEVAEGMRLLDEAAAAALGGELTDPFAILNVPCYLIYACKRVRDYERAAQWCDLTKELAERLGDRVTFAACRLHYADVLLWRGAWEEVERELDAVVRELTGLSPRKVADAAVRVGELRRRQGRPEEALELFRQGEHHPLSTLGRASLAIDRARSAACQASIASAPGSSQANSSPPTRATISPRREHAASRRATSVTTWSPTGWPNSSLIRLKWSRSSSTSASGRPERSDWATSSSSRSW